MIELGSKVTDMVTGVTGIATARVEYLNGCVQYAVEPLAKQGEKGVCHYVDEGQLEVVSEGIKSKLKNNIEKMSKAKPAEAKEANKPVRTGGPQGYRTPRGIRK